VLVCRRCSSTTHIWASVTFHMHGHTNVALVPRALRVVPLAVRAELVEEALGWLDEHWQGGVFVPDELLPLVGVT
jgi:hypothetical protein